MAHALPDDVLSAAQSGDPAAFSSIYTTLAPGVTGYLRARGMEDTEASVQEVFLTVFSRIGTVRGGWQGLRTFTFSVAHARYVDEVRRRARHPGFADYDPGADPRTTGSAEEAVLDSLAASDVGKQLKALNPDQREVLLLRIVADLSLEQVAEIMGKSTGSIKQLQRRGLLKLKSLIERKEALV
ncbi:RNA polymerase sigma factor [Arthrobacter sp. I2-34]|uniref:RNA polymerase sigma factor n=1 Tax=Arthrobacter hankyongi TaxID=2904801 RepID=A0ABS9L2D9_9MICC|nr:RNA polymerase sigma factor [Arthrobacter hankyongi]MCG2620807.1 RNA polymerase sigma factor [Arthrobacter hankyongi]